jgi:hypothetical protein
MGCTKGIIGVILAILALGDAIRLDALILQGGGGSPLAKDIKIVRRIRGLDGRWHQLRTTYVKGYRQRIEFPDSNRVTIYQCDSRQVIDLDLAHRLFNINELDKAFLPPGGTKAKRLSPHRTYTYIITTEDTGERAKVFGFDAWHVREVTKETTSADPTPTMTVVDNWYVDLGVLEWCGAWRYYDAGAAREAIVAAHPGSTLKRSGTANQGFPVLTRTVVTHGKHRREYVSDVDLSTNILDPGLFEIPAGFQPALKIFGRAIWSLPDTPTNRLRVTAELTWNSFWESAAKVIF